MADIDSLAAYTTSVEGPDEVNTNPVSYQGLTGNAAAIAFQADFYRSVHADPLLTQVKVLPFSLSVGGDQTGFGNLSAYADAGNIHAYCSGGGAPNQAIAYEKGLVAMTPGETDYLTETGYYTIANGTSGVTDYVQAIWTIDSLLDGTADGIAKTFIYELSDATGASPSDPEGHYGLFTASGQAKPVATAISNLTHILADTGANASTFTAAAPALTVSGLAPVNGLDQVFQKSNGQTDVALWSELNFYNPATNTLTTFSQPVTLDFQGSFYNVSVYDPLVGTAAIKTFTDVSSVQVSLGNDPLVVELTPVGTATLSAPQPPANSAPVTIGSGSHTLALSMSEDAWQGDALFTISVDGTQVGGTQTTTASHALKQDQVFNVLGNFAAGAHTVTVTFLNDAYGGTGKDRNLYLDGTTLDGAAIAGGSLALPQTGPRSFTFGGSSAGTSAVVVGSGSDVLALSVAEDVYAGDARFTVTVDGKQIGGVQTATASHNTGQSQTFDIEGSFGLGSHTVGVTFLNDAYAGAGMDRNLYVTGASYDGAVQPGVALAEYRNGTQSAVVTSATTYNETAAATVTTLGNDTVRIGAGNVTVNATGPSVNVTGGAGALTFIAAAGNDTVNAGSGASTLVGGAGRLLFNAGGQQCGCHGRVRGADDRRHGRQGGRQPAGQELRLRHRPDPPVRLHRQRRQQQQRERRFHPHHAGGRDEHHPGRFRRQRQPPGLRLTAGTGPAWSSRTPPRASGCRHGASARRRSHPSLAPSLPPGPRTAGRGSCAADARARAPQRSAAQPGAPSPGAS